MTLASLVVGATIGVIGTIALLALVAWLADRPEPWWDDDGP